MKEYFKPTTKKILGVIILTVMFSLGGVIPYLANPLSFITGESNIVFGLPFPYASLDDGTISNVNILNMIIDIIIFYFVICLLSMIFRGKKKEDKSNQASQANQVNQTNQEEGRKEEYVPNSDSGGGNPGPADETQPQY
jgi:hypothetical protein